MQETKSRQTYFCVISSENTKKQSSSHIFFCRFQSKNMQYMKCTALKNEKFERKKQKINSTRLYILLNFGNFIWEQKNEIIAELVNRFN
jgi:hypothetical protein